jgi:hypothetical protein
MSARPHVFEDLFAQAMERFGSSDTQALHIADREDMQNFLGFSDDLNQVGLEDFKGAFTQRVAQRGVYTEAPGFTIRDHEDRAVAVDLMKELARPEMADLKEALLTRLRGWDRRTSHQDEPIAVQVEAPETGRSTSLSGRSLLLHTGLGPATRRATCPTTEWKGRRQAPS